MNRTSEHCINPGGLDSTYKRQHGSFLSTSTIAVYRVGDRACASYSSHHASTEYMTLPLNVIM
jgi:hypothetical protein